MVKVMSYDAWASFELEHPEAKEANERWLNADPTVAATALVQWK
ncbi:hypothetical protein [Paenibacillus amylolyticus]